MREQFHPVVKLPKRKGWKIWAQKRITKRHQKEKAAAEEDNSNTCNSQRGLMATYDYMVKDYTLGNNSHDVMLHGGKKVPQLLLTREEALEFARTQNMKSRPFDVGRYDEDRRGMYTSTLFEDDDSRRTLHVGIDIGGPLGMKIYSFSNGVVHSLGYNDAIGDYGYVIVVEHHLNATSKCWALYGHLDANSIKGKSEGQKIDKGEVIGSIGDASENGGWTGYHLHFQLALHPPKTHDMPGVVALKDRETALLEYPDPRYVLGELY
jgi:murein DD-endopeptidase MepM/ murein hydrolase activator NlpD